MVDSVSKFARELDIEFDAILEKDLLELKKEIANYALKGVLDKMPVDTGLAKSNVIVSLAVRNPATVLTTDKSGDATLARGKATIDGDPSPFIPVYIQNNLPYIERLENGHSKQAPEGMFALTVDEIEAKFK